MTTTDMPVDETRRLTRSQDNRIVAGVCGGAARYWDIDPVIPRVVVAVLAVFGGAGLAIYAFGWLLIPEDGSPSTRLERWLEGKGGDRGRDLLIVVIALFALSFLIDSHPFAHRLSGVALVIVLALTVTAIIGRRHSERLGTPWLRTGLQAPPRSPPPFGPMPDPSMQPTASWPMPPVQPPWPRPPRQRSWLGWLTLGLMLLVAGGFSVVAEAGWAHPQPADVLAACVGVVGVGLLVGTVFGRAWSLIPLGVVLVGCLAAANALPRNLTWTAGNRTWTPVVAPTSPYVLGAGDARLDLSQLPAHEAATVAARMGAGRLTVDVPPGTTVVVHATASAGRVVVFGQEQDGTSVDVHQTVTASTVNPRVLTLNLAIGFGDVEVNREAA